jgi:hypothetical protein
MKEVAYKLDKIRKLLPVSRYLAIFAVVSVCSFPSIKGFAAEPKPAAPSVPAASPPATAAPPAPPPPTDIPLADIAARATEVSNLLSSLTTAAVPGAQIENIAKTLPDLSEKLDAQFAAMTTALEAEPTLETLQGLQQQWQRQQVETTALLSALTQQATNFRMG